MPVTSAIKLTQCYKWKLSHVTNTITSYKLQNNFQCR